MDKLKIPTPRMPTDKERLAYATKNMARYSPYMMNNTYHLLSERMVPAVFVSLTEEEAISLREFVMDETPSRSSAEHMAQDTALMPIIAAINAQKPDVPFFTRLNSRSPKDAYSSRYVEGRQIPSENGIESLLCLFYSERIYTDLLDAIPTKSPVSIVLRPHLTHIKNENEFRIFVENGEIAGMSRMFYHDDIPAWIEERKTEIDAALRGLAAFCSEKLKNLESFTIDALIFENGTEPLTAQALEINPPLSGGSTDPLIFTETQPDGQLHIEKSSRPRPFFL